MSDFPTHWVPATLADVGRWGSGGTPRTGESSYYEGTIPWIRSGDLPDGLIREHPASISETGLVNSSAKWVPEHALLIALYGATIGKLGITTYPVTTNQAVAFCVPDENVTSAEFLFWYLLAARPELIALGKGGAQPNISQTILKGHSLLLPPRDEQRRIVATLTSLFERLNSAREELTHVPQLIERHRRAILATELFDNFATGRNSISCEQNSLEDLCDNDRGITYGVIKLGMEEPDGVPCLRTSNVRWLEIDTDGMKRINPRLSQEYGRTILKGGEVLVNVRGTLGGVAVVPTEMEGWNVSREVAVVPVNPLIANPHYVAYSIASDNSQQWLRGVQKGVAYTGINLSDLRRLQVNLPSVEAQEEIVRRVRASHANAAAILAEAKRSESLFDRLEQATLTKAFRGELVFHDPNDSPVRIPEKSPDVTRARPRHAATVSSLPRRKRLTRGATMAKKRAEVSRNHLADTLRALGGKADPKKLWQRSEMDIDEFYKQLRDEIKAGHITEDASKERLKLAHAT